MGFISVVVDGPSGAGKSTMAKRLAEALGYVYVDTGAIYRTLGLLARRSGTDPEDAQAVSELLKRADIQLRYEADGLQHMLLSGEDVTAEIRLPEISQYASAVSAQPAVRAFLLDMQRDMAKHFNVIMDGRDIGTVVLPDAQAKIFLTATPEDRASRRCAELEDRGTPQDYETVLAEIGRASGGKECSEPGRSRWSPDHEKMDTTGKSLDESFAILLDAIRRKLEA